jgi:hypothetical protein
VRASSSPAVGRAAPRPENEFAGPGLHLTQSLANLVAARHDDDVRFGGHLESGVSGCVIENHDRVAIGGREHEVSNAHQFVDQVPDLITYRTVESEELEVALETVDVDPAAVFTPLDVHVACRHVGREEVTNGLVALGWPSLDRHEEIVGTQDQEPRLTDMDDADLHAPLVDQGRRLFEILAPGATLNTIVLDDGAGICMTHAVRGGGKIYVAPDLSVLFVASALDFEQGLAAFQAGRRTPLEKFDRRS